MMRIGLAGQACAKARGASAAATEATSSRRVIMQAPRVILCRERTTPWRAPGKRLRRLLVLLRRMLAGDLEEVLQDLVAVLGGDALGVELHAMDGQRLVAQAHDDVAGLGGDFEILWETGTVDDPRMLARGLEGGRDVLEHALAFVLPARSPTMHGFRL